MSLAEDLVYASLVQVAEGVPPGQEYGPTQLNQLRDLGYELLEVIYGDDLATDLTPNLGGRVTFGFVAKKGSEAVAALRGTANILEWVQDGKFLMVPNPVGPGLAEDGFVSVYRSLRLRALSGATEVTAAGYLRSLVASGQVMTTGTLGHSLGGALASLLALGAASAFSRTWGSPRVLDHVGAGSYNQRVPDTRRFENRFDLVPKLPLPFPLPYEHVSQRVELNGKFSLNPAQEHHLTTYISLMRAASV